MLAENRWILEQKIMQENFATFHPWKRGDKFGFQGYLRLNGKKPYEVVIQGCISNNPFEEPKIYINPHPEEHHWMRSNGMPFLSHQRLSAWTPKRSTFASYVLVAMQYLKEFG